jgi:hypothetical protein
MSTAERLRRFRERRANGQAVYRVVLDQVDLEELLIAARTLAPEDRDDHAAAEDALRRLVELLVQEHRNS